MNPLAQETNHVIEGINPHTFHMLSHVGKKLFFPRGILAQSAEAKQKAYRYNATIGMAMEKNELMYLPSVMEMLPGFKAEQAISYAPSFGLQGLREAWKAELLRKNPSLKGKDFSLPVVTQAITHGLSVVADMWVDPGDVVILGDKLWGNYNMIFGVRRAAKVLTFPLLSKGGGLDVEGLQATLIETSKNRDKILLLLNFPNNPTGYTPTQDEARKIAGVVKELGESGKEVVVICDDAYFGLVYEEGVFSESMFTLLMDVHPRVLAIKLDAATKENYVWGLRVGFITYGTRLEGDPRPFYDALEKKTAGCIRGSISNASRLSQEIVLRSINSKGYLEEKDQKYKVMKERANEIKRILHENRYLSNFEAYPFNSGYFMCIKVKGVDAERVRLHLLEKYGVGVIALGDTDIRIAYSCVEKEDLNDLFEIINRAIEELKN